MDAEIESSVSSVIPQLLAAIRLRVMSRDVLPCARQWVLFNLITDRCMDLSLADALTN